jgi:hypothetical protein
VHLQTCSKRTRTAQRQQGGGFSLLSHCCSMSRMLLHVPCGPRVNDAREHTNHDEAFQIFTDHIAERPHVKDQVVCYNCSWPNADGAADYSATGHDDHPSPSAGKPLWIRYDQQPTASCRAAEASRSRYSCTVTDSIFSSSSFTTKSFMLCVFVQSL